MPGLVNGHCHGDMGFAKGGADNTTLGEQMERFAEHNWYYDRVTDEDRYHARLLTYAEALLSGTTMLVEHVLEPRAPLAGGVCEDRPGAARRRRMCDTTFTVRTGF